MDLLPAKPNNSKAKLMVNDGQEINAAESSGVRITQSSQQLVYFISLLYKTKNLNIKVTIRLMQRKFDSLFFSIHLYH